MQEPGTPLGAGREGALEGLRRDPAAQLPCPSMGTKKVPKPQDLLQGGHLPSSPRPLNHGPAPARAHPACHVAPPGHHRPLSSQRRGVVLSRVAVPVMGRVPLPSGTRGRAAGGEGCRGAPAWDAPWVLARCSPGQLVSRCGYASLCPPLGWRACWLARAPAPGRRKHLPRRRGRLSAS